LHKKEKRGLISLRESIARIKATHCGGFFHSQPRKNHNNAKKIMLHDVRQGQSLPVRYWPEMSRMPPLDEYSEGIRGGGGIGSGAHFADISSSQPPRYTGLLGRVRKQLMYNHDEVLSDLRNWGRAMNDEWLEHNLLPKTAGIFREYRPDAGNIFDIEPCSEPVDQAKADKTESVVIQIGLQHFDAYQALVMWYCHHYDLEEIARKNHWSSQTAKRKRIEGERLYYELKHTKQRAAA